MTNINAAFEQKILYIPERKWEPHIQHHCQTDNLGAAVEILEGIAFARAQTLREHPTRLDRIPSVSF